MQPIRLYASSQADHQVLNLALDLAQSGREVQLLPLSLLPQPDPEHRQRLRVERAELVDSLRLTEWSLEQYRTGQWQPDAGMENGLQFDREALQSRLTAVNRILGAEKGGLPHG